MKNSSLTNSKGVPIKSYAKFEFVGTNNLGEITTYHVESGKTFWKMMNNGENISVINPIKQEEFMDNLVAVNKIDSLVEEKVEL